MIFELEQLKGTKDFGRFAGSKAAPNIESTCQAFAVDTAVVVDEAAGAGAGADTVVTITDEAIVVLIPEGVAFE